MQRAITTIDHLEQQFQRLENQKEGSDDEHENEETDDKTENTETHQLQQEDPSQDTQILSSKVSSETQDLQDMQDLQVFDGQIEVQTQSELIQIQVKKTNQQSQQVIILDNSEEQELQSLQELVDSQRRTMDSLTKTNKKLTLQMERIQEEVNRKITNFKQKHEKIQKKLQKEIKKNLKKLDKFKKETTKEKHLWQRDKLVLEETLRLKGEQIGDLKHEHKQIQKIINAKDLTRKNYEMKGQIKQLVQERTRLFSQLYKLRKENGEMKETIFEKDELTKILKNNICTILEQKEQPGTGFQKTISFINKKHKHVSKRRKSKRKKQRSEDLCFLDMDQHVKKPIRGGGGNQQAWEKQNQIRMPQRSKQRAINQGDFLPRFKISNIYEQNSSSKTYETLRR